ncbi:MAG: hypothetical protein ABI547_03945 [Betaproteobacteria bacterium]
MPLSSALTSDTCAFERPACWWLSAPRLQQEIQSHGSTIKASACYQLGGAVLEFAVDDPALLEAFQQLYADCAISQVAAAHMPRVRCTLRRGGDPLLLLLTFEAGAPADPAGAAFHLLRATQAVPPYSIHDSPITDWRLAGGKLEPVLAARGPHVLIAPWQVSRDFLIEYLAGITLAMQPDVLAVHGASLLMGAAGVMLVGGSHAGKTTTALHLAARGHILFGDELALLRLAASEILPFRRTVNLRPGPRSPELTVVTGRLDKRQPLKVDDHWVDPYWISEVFPGVCPRSAPLRAVFFLGGFAERAAVEAFRLTLDDKDVIDWLAQPAIAYGSWGSAPERRTLRLLALVQVLSRVPCWMLKVGAPLETANLIEQTMRSCQC